MKFVNGQIFFRDSTEMTYSCWNTFPSTEILLYSTTHLNEDIIEKFPIIKIASQSPKFEVKYSINVKQYSLTKPAYEYWQIIQKNTHQLGSLFDPQPSQLIGNIRNITNANEPVIGFVTASTVQEKRIFILRGQIANGYTPGSTCTTLFTTPDSATFYLANNPFNAPAYFTTGGGLAITSIQCVDCRLKGGVNLRPSFW
ncbi:MAG: DUF4249 family protein [Chitinophagaceae bacterium]|nr:DUF4249 family protein [Chitinophagaceae bacterium]